MTVLNTAFLEEFGRSKAETSLVQAVVGGTLSISCLPAGAAVGKFGVRKIGICGSLLASLGLVLSFFATSIPYLVVTAGLIEGVGLSACYISATTSVGEYFEGRSKLEALSILSFGTGCGGMMYPYLLEFLTREFGWRGCLLIVGGIMLNIVPCFVICEPRTVGVSAVDRSETISIGTINSVSTISSGRAPYSKEDRLCEKLTKLMKNKAYMIFTLAVLINIPPLFSLTIFLINFLQTKGFNQPTAVFLYTMMNFAGTIFRLAPGFLKRIPNLSVLMIPAIFSIFGTAACAFIPGATTYTQHIILLGMFGISVGGGTTVMSVTNMKLLSMDTYSIGLGLTVFAMGISSTCGGPISGYFRDVSGSYDLSFYVASVGLGVASCLYLLGAVIRKYETKDAKRSSENVENGIRGTKRRTSILPWEGTVEFIYM